MIAFLGVAALLIVTPGPDTALTIRNSLRGGRRTFAKAGEALGGAWLRRVADGLAGVVMIGLAGRLAGERR